MDDSSSSPPPRPAKRQRNYPPHSQNHQSKIVTTFNSSSSSSSSNYVNSVNDLSSPLVFHNDHHNSSDSGGDKLKRYRSHTQTLSPSPSDPITHDHKQHVDCGINEELQQISARFKQHTTACLLNRDWNNDYQMIFDRTASTPFEQRKRTNDMTKLLAEYQTHTQAVAMAIMTRKTYPNYHPPLVEPSVGIGGVAGGVKFAVGHVIYKFSVDDECVYSETGGDDLQAHKAAMLEMKAIDAMIGLDIRSLHSTLVCVHRHRGHCVYAIAKAPLGQLVYGSNDGGDTVADASTPSLRMVRGTLEHAAHLLHLRTHSVSSVPEVKQLCHAADMECHIGTDDRLYLVDLAREMPPTPLELGTTYHSFLVNQFRPEMMMELRRRGLNPLSSDAYSAFSVPKESEQDTQDITAAFEYLMQQVIPQLARQLDADNEKNDDLSRVFHTHGVNIRYLPCVAARCAVDGRTRLYLCEEMIVRYMKVYTRRQWNRSANRSAAQLLDDVCKYFIQSSVVPLNDDVICGVCHKYRGVADTIGQLKHELQHVNLLGNHGAVLLRVLDALNIEYDGSLPLTNTQQLQQHRGSWRLVPEVRTVTPPRFIELNERERVLNEDIELRQRSGLSTIAPLLQLLELYKVWSRDEASVSRTNGMVVARRLLDMVAVAAGEGEASNTDMAMVLVGVGEFYRRFQMMHEQLSVCVRARDMLSAEDSTENKEGLLHVLDTMGAAYRFQENYTDALKCAEEALVLSEQLYGEDHIQVAYALDNVGDVCRYEGEYVKALEYCERARKLIEFHQFDREHPLVASNLYGIANIYGHQGDYTRALDYYQEVLRIQIAAFTAVHPDVARTLHNMGGVCYYQQKYDQALEYLQRSLEISVQLYGDIHREVGGTLNTMGVVLGAQGCHANALAHFEHAFSVLQESCGEHYPILVDVLFHTAELYAEQNDSIHVHECCERILSLPCRATESNTLHRIGACLARVGECANAMEYFERAISVLPGEPNNDGNIFELAQIQRNLALTHASIGDHESAVKHYQLSIDCFSSLDNQQKDVAETLMHVAVMWHGCGKRYDNKTMECYSRALEIQTEANDTNGQLESLYNIGCVLHRQDEYVGAFQYFVRVLPLQVSALGIDHPDVTRTLVCMSDAILSAATGDNELVDLSLLFCQYAVKFYLDRDMYVESVGVFRQMSYVAFNRGDRRLADEYNECARIIYETLVENKK